MNTLRLSFCLILLLTQAAVAPELLAQVDPPPSSDEVVGFSYIQPPNGSTITYYAGTEMGVDVAAQYDAQVLAFLYQGSSLVSSGNNTGNPTAEGVQSVSSAASTFQLYSYHYLISPSYDNDYQCWADAYGFAGISPFDGYGAVYAHSPASNQQFHCSSTQTMYIGRTTWQQYGKAPQINSITSSAPLTLNSGGTLTIAGQFLTAGGNDINPTVTVTSGTGLSLGSTVTVVNDSTLQVSYTIDSNPGSVGAHAIVVSTASGSSNQGNAQVGDPTPVITSITPNPWVAGTAYSCSIQIHGTGFGTNPVPNITSDHGTEIGSFSPCGTPSDTLIMVSVTTNTSYQAGSVTVTVRSQGYNVSGFIAVSGNSSGSNPEQVQVTPQPLPALQIFFNGTNIANNGNPSCPGDPACVVVGQRIALTAIMTQGGSQVVPGSQQWSPPVGNVIANFIGSNQSGALIPLPNPNGSSTDCQSSFTQNCLTFYWVDQGNSRIVTYTSTIGGNPGPTATMTFKVAGPTNVNVVAQTTIVGIQTAPPEIEFGVGEENRGIDLKVTSATLPQGNQGAYSWIQLVLASTVHYVTSSLGIRHCVASVFASDTSPALDTNYPLVIGNEMDDSPSIPLQASTPSNGNIGEIAGGSKFETYLMWTPTAASGCTSPNGAPPCTIATPLGKVNWQYSGDAINTLQLSNPWTLTPPGCSLPNTPVSIPFQVGTSYPEWHKFLESGSGGISCHN